MMEEEDSEDFTIEHVTREEYTKVRQTIEDGITEYADNIMKKGIAQDMLMDLFHEIGYVVCYKKETEKCIEYDYAIGLAIDRDDYK